MENVDAQEAHVLVSFDACRQAGSLRIHAQLTAEIFAYALHGYGKNQRTLDKNMRPLCGVGRFPSG